MLKPYMPDKTDFTLTDPFKERIKIFALYGLLVGIAFFSVYPTMNWFSEYRGISYKLHFDRELSIPFVYQTIWLYLSLYLQFLLPPFLLNCRELRKLAYVLIISTLICGLIYLAFPAKLGFERTLPEDPLYEQIYRTLFAVAKPYNTAPSLHVVYITTISFYICNQWKRSIVTGLFTIWTIALSASTVLVHQHHLADVFSAYLLVLAVSKYVEKKYA